MLDVGRGIFETPGKLTKELVLLSNKLLIVPKDEELKDAFNMSLEMAGCGEVMGDLQHTLCQNCATQTIY